jgi:hypothetical protein
MVPFSKFKKVTFYCCWLRGRQASSHPRIGSKALPPIQWAREFKYLNIYIYFLKSITSPGGDKGYYDVPNSLKPPCFLFFLKKFIRCTSRPSKIVDIFGGR